MSFASDLERKCQRVLKTAALRYIDGPEASVWRQIALVLEQLQNHRGQHKTLMTEFERLERHLEDRLLWLDDTRHVGLDARFEKERLRSNLLHSRVRLEHQRHDLARENESTHLRLMDRLLTLWNQSCEFGVENEPKRSPRKTRSIDA